MLHCDARSVVACSEKAIVEQSSPGGRARRRAVKMAAGEVIVEGVYLPSERTVCVLIGRKVVPNNFNVLEVRKAWQEMRPVWVDLEKP